MVFIDRWSFYTGFTECGQSVLGVCVICYLLFTSYCVFVVYSMVDVVCCLLCGGVVYCCFVVIYFTSAAVPMLMPRG